MSIEWFRDLSITILGFVATAVLIFTALLVYRLYRMLKSTVLLIKAVSKMVYNTATLVQESINPLLSVLALIQGIREGFERFIKKAKKENSEGEENGD